MRVAPPVVIDHSQKAILEQWARSRSLPVRQAYLLVCLPLGGRHTEASVPARFCTDNWFR
jgi:hypothetical protein